MSSRRRRWLGLLGFLPNLVLVWLIGGPRSVLVVLGFLVIVAAGVWGLLRLLGEP